MEVTDQARPSTVDQKDKVYLELTPEQMRIMLEDTMREGSGSGFGHIIERYNYYNMLVTRDVVSGQMTPEEATSQMLSVSSRVMQHSADKATEPAAMMAFNHASAITQGILASRMDQSGQPPQTPQS